VEERTEPAFAPAGHHPNEQQPKETASSAPTHADREDRSRLTRWVLGRLQQKRVRTAVAGYAVVIVFAVASGIALTLGASATTALVVGALAAAPIVIALIGERITGVKALGLEVTLVALTEVKVEVAGDDSTIAGGLAAAALKGAQSGYSDNIHLVEDFETLISEAPKLLQINLRSDDYWWSTRIFLVAALAQDYTNVDAIVFVRSGDDEVFVGIASARAVRERLAAQFPIYEEAYRRAQDVVPHVDQADKHRHPNVNKIKSILKHGKWQEALAGIGAKEKEPRTIHEKDIKEIVSSKKLRQWLGAELDTECLPYRPLNALMAYRVVSRNRRYAALTLERRLKAVVDRDELAARCPASKLERVLGGRSLKR
jgi:hypothetical protein